MRRRATHQSLIGATDAVARNRPSAAPATRAEERDERRSIMPPVQHQDRPQIILRFVRARALRRGTPLSTMRDLGTRARAPDREAYRKVFVELAVLPSSPQLFSTCG